MPSIPNRPSYSHGSTGTAPSTSIDYANGDAVDQSEFDYFIYTPFNKIKGIIDFLDAVDSNGDGQVDAADSAVDATNVTSTYKGNDIDSDGDGKVNAADDATNVTSTYKGNDIDSNGDGVVDAADQVNTGGTAAVIRDTTNSTDLLVANEGGPVNVPVALQQGGSPVITDADAGGGLSGGSGSLAHADTSTQGDVAAGAGAAVTDVTVDGYGHVTSLGTTDFDSRYVLGSGDTMSGSLTINNDLVVTNTSGTETVSVPVYASTSDLPSGTEGEIAYVSADGLYVYK